MRSRRLWGLQYYGFEATTGRRPRVLSLGSRKTHRQGNKGRGDGLTEEQSRWSESSVLISYAEDEGTLRLSVFRSKTCA